MTSARRRPRRVPFRLGFAVEVLGQGGRKASDARRRRPEPHPSRSLEVLDAVRVDLHRIDVGGGYDDRVAARSRWAYGRLRPAGAGRAAGRVPPLVDHTPDVVTPLDLRAQIEGATRSVGRAEERAAALAA